SIFADFNKQHNVDKVVEEILTDSKDEGEEKVVDDILQESKEEENGFAFCKTHSEIDKDDNISRRRVYMYTKGQVYTPYKEAHTIDERDRGHNSNEIQSDIRLLASCEVRAGSIIEVLQQKYPRKYIHTHNVYNMIQTIRYKKRIVGDAGSTYLELIKKQQDEPGYYVDAKFEG
ncbi:7321_t:CDS:2, partial [Racocetra fulgida]